MTDTRSLYTKPSLEESLKDAWEFLTSLVDVAHQCRWNFTWLSLNNAVSVPLLDFDVICGALPSIAVSVALDERSADDAIANKLIGPYTMRYLLSTMKEGSFSIPPGTTFEFMRYQSESNKRLRTHVEALGKKLQRAKDSSDPVRTFVDDSSANLAEALWKTLDEVTLQVDETSLLGSILEHHIPIESLLGPEREKKNRLAFDRALRLLQAKRPRVSMNNLSDALNVAVVVRMFNCPSYTGQRRQVPVLISTTKQIVSLDADEELGGLLSDKTPPRVLLSDLYLIVSQGLLKLSRDYYESVAIKATNLSEEARKLADCYEGLVFRVTRLRQERGMDENDISLDDLPESDIDLLRYHHERFKENWKPVIAPAWTSAENDRLHYLNSLMTPQIKENLGSKVPAHLNRGLEQLRSRLLEFVSAGDKIPKTPK